MLEQLEEKAISDGIEYGFRQSRDLVRAVRRFAKTKNLGTSNDARLIDKAIESAQKRNTDTSYVAAFLLGVKRVDLRCLSR